MIKVLYIVSTLKRTGPINVVYNLIYELDKHRFEPVILTLSAENDDKTSKKADFLNLGIAVYSLSLTRLQGIFFAKSKIKQFIKDKGINVLHLTGLRPDLLVNASINLPTISSIQSNIYDDYTLLYGNVIGRIAAYLHIRSLKGKSGVACSGFVASELYNRYGIALPTILNGVPSTFYTSPSADKKSNVKAHLCLTQYSKIFVSAAYFIDRKNPETIIKAFLESDPSKNSVLLMLGDGHLLNHCKNIANSNNRILFLGNVSNVSDYFTASDFYISAALSEGLPLSVMEAMAFGLPVILSDIKPHLELLEFLPNWPYRFDIRSIEQLVKSIDSILYENYEDLSYKTNQVIKNHINSKIMASQFEALYLKA